MPERSRKGMGRDRAKEKIQAHRKVRLEKKESKAEERAETERELKNKTLNNAVSGHRKKNVKDGHTDRLLDHRNFVESLNAEDTSASGDANYSKIQPSSSNSGAVQDECCTSSQLPPGGDRSKEINNNTKMNLKTKSTTKAFASGNPNHRDYKPQWRNIHEEAAARKAERKTMKMPKNLRSAIAPRNLRLEDILKPDELRQLRDILDINGLDRVCPAVGAVALGRFDLVKKLMNDGLFHLQFIEGQKITPMGCAIQTKNWDFIDFILEKNLSPHCKDSFGNTPLIKAALSPNWTDSMMFELWSSIKEDPRTDISGHNMAGVTLVHALALRGWPDVLNDILDINFEDKDITVADLVNAVMWDGCTPLMLAIDGGHEATCKLLLRRGAKPLVEDKAGFTPMCRAMGFLYNTIPNFSKGTVIPSACEIIMTLLTHKTLANWDIKSYMHRRLQAIKNPSIDCTNFPEVLNRLGRAVLMFPLRCLQGGSEMLLQLRVFYKLSETGHKNIIQNDVLYAVLGMIFEILVYAEDFTSLWPRYTDAFLREGAAELCLLILQRQSNFDNPIGPICKTKDHHSSTLSVSEVSSFPDFKEVPESLAYLEPPPPAKKSIPLAAILPFVQLIDSSGMDSWFLKHFEVLSTSYRALVKEGPAFILSSKLTPQHEDRTNRKAILFNNLMVQDHWISPNDKEMWKTTIFQYQKVSKIKKESVKPIPVQNPVPHNSTCNQYSKDDKRELQEASSKLGNLLPIQYRQAENCKSVMGVLEETIKIKLDRTEESNASEDLQTLPSKVVKDQKPLLLTPTITPNNEGSTSKLEGGKETKKRMGIRGTELSSSEQITPIFGSWYHDVMFMLENQANSVSPETDSIFFQGLSVVNDIDSWKQIRREILLKGLDYYEGNCRIIKLIKEHLVFLDKSKSMHRDDLLAAAERIEFSNSLKFAAKAGTIANGLFMWLSDRKSIMTRGYGGSLIAKSSYLVGKYKHKEFATLQPFEILNDIDICYAGWTNLETAANAKRFYVNFEKDNNIVSKIRTLKDGEGENCCLTSVSAVTMPEIELTNDSYYLKESSEVSKLAGLSSTETPAPRSGIRGRFWSSKANTKTFVSVEGCTQTIESMKTITKPKLKIRTRKSVYKKALKSRSMFVPTRISHGTIFDGFKISYQSKDVSTKQSIKATPGTPNSGPKNEPLSVSDPKGNGNSRILENDLISGLQLEEYEYEIEETTIQVVPILSTEGRITFLPMLDSGKQENEGGYMKASKSNEKSESQYTTVVETKSVDRNRTVLESASNDTGKSKTVEEAKSAQVHLLNKTEAGSDLNWGKVVANPSSDSRNQIVILQSDVGDMKVPTKLRTVRTQTQTVQVKKSRSHPDNL